MMMIDDNNDDGYDDGKSADPPGVERYYNIILLYFIR